MEPIMETIANATFLGPVGNLKEEKTKTIELQKKELEEKREDISLQKQIKGLNIEETESTDKKQSSQFERISKKMKKL
jgi:hypothetical protein